MATTLVEVVAGQMESLVDIGGGWPNGKFGRHRGRFCFLRRLIVIFSGVLCARGE